MHAGPRQRDACIHACMHACVVAIYGLPSMGCHLWQVELLVSVLRNVPSFASMDAPSLEQLLRVSIYEEAEEDEPGALRVRVRVRAFST